MKILGIVGSIRDGNTLIMVNRATQAIRNFADVELLHLKNLKFTFCNGCLKCDETGWCCLKDDMNDVLDKMKEADGYIIGTPTRWGLMSGELKSFLDRLNPLATSELLEGKKAVILAVGQSQENEEDGESIRTACASVETFCNNAGIEVLSTICAYECLKERDILEYENMLQQCAKAAEQLINN